LQVEVGKGKSKSDRFSGQLRTKEDAEGRHALLKADGKYELDTLAKGSGKEAKESEFQARNDRFDFRLNPANQSERQGHGILSFKDKASDYKTFKYISSAGWFL
jgi:hypothetical protein